MSTKRVQPTISSLAYSVYERMAAAKGMPVNSEIAVILEIVATSSDYHKSIKAVEDHSRMSIGGVTSSKL